MYLYLALGLATVAAAGLAGAAGEGVDDCPGIPVQVVAGSTEDRALVCDGAGRAVAFLRTNGLEIKDTIRIQLRAFAMPSGASHIGTYNPATREIELLTYEQTQLQTAQETPFDIPMDKRLYTSFATHEVAHAIAHQHAVDGRALYLGHEYLAYVAQISTMDSATRGAVLQRSQLEGFADADEMSFTYYALDPSAFAIKAYRHYLALDDRRAFLAGLLSGAIRPGRARRETW